MSSELPTPEREEGTRQSLESVVEEDQVEDILGGDPSASEGSAAQKKASPSFRRRRNTEEFRLSAVIKLDYDLSDPIYAVIKDLILKYVLMWVLPNNSQRRGGGISGSPVPSPLLSHRPKFVRSGIELMRDMWFTSRDNVSMLLEICRQGFQTPLLQTYTLRKLIELYFHWEQVKVVNLLDLIIMFMSLSLFPPFTHTHTHTHSYSHSHTHTIFIDVQKASIHAAASRT